MFGFWAKNNVTDYFSKCNFKLPIAAHLGIFVLIFVVATSDSGAAMADGYITGAKLLDGRLFTTPGATTSFRRIMVNGSVTHLAGYGPSFDREHPNFSASLPAGHYELGIQVPDGYEASYSICYSCNKNSSRSFTAVGAYNGATIYVDVAENVPVDILIAYSHGPTQNRYTANQSLTCNIPGLPNPTPPTDVLLFKGSDAWARIGINRTIGGIGVMLDLINPDAPSRSLQIVEARSSGGAAWQTGVGVADGTSNRIWHFNQAAGNSAQVWGYGGDYLVNQSVGFIQRDWSPIFANDFRPAVDFTTASVTVSPCYHTGSRLGDGKMSLTSKIIQTETGRVIEINNSYSVRTREDQNWLWIMADQALYLDSAAARSADMRIYFVGESQSKKYTVGPVRPYDAFAKFPMTNVRNLICLKDDCMMASERILYSVLVWKVAGKDIALAVHPEDQKATYFGFVRLRNDLLCKGNDSCGNIQFHTRLVDGTLDRNAPKTFDAGVTKTYSVIYSLGTLPQLKELGFNIPSLN